MHFIFLCCLYIALCLFIIMIQSFFSSCYLFVIINNLTYGSLSQHIYKVDDVPTLVYMTYVLVMVPSVCLCEYVCVWTCKLGKEFRIIYLYSSVNNCILLYETTRISVCSLGNNLCLSKFSLYCSSVMLFLQEHILVVDCGVGRAL